MLNGLKIVDLNAMKWHNSEFKRTFLNVPIIDICLYLLIQLIENYVFTGLALMIGFLFTMLYVSTIIITITNSITLNKLKHEPIQELTYDIKDFYDNSQYGNQMVFYQKESDSNIYNRVILSSNLTYQYNVKEADVETITYKCWIDEKKGKIFISDIVFNIL